MKLLLAAAFTATAVLAQIPGGGGGGGTGPAGPTGPTGPAGAPGTLGTVVSYSSNHPVAQSDCGNSITASASLTFTFPITITPPCQLYVISTSASATISTALSGGATYNLGTTPLPTFGPISGTVAAGQVFTEDAAGSWHSAAGPTGATGPGYTASSTTSNAISGTGTYTWTLSATCASVAYTAGQTVGAYSAAAPTTNNLVGTVTSCSGSTLILAITVATGSGTHTDWNFGIAALSGGTPGCGSGTIQINNSGAFGCVTGSSSSGGSITVTGNVTAGANGRAALQQQGDGTGSLLVQDNFANSGQVGQTAAFGQATLLSGTYMGGLAATPNFVALLNGYQIRDGGQSEPVCSVIGTTPFTEMRDFDQINATSGDIHQWCGQNSDATSSWKGPLGGSYLITQNAALSAHALVTPSSTGMYRVSYTAKVTTAGTTSILGGTTGFVLNFTDGTDSVAQTLTVQGFNQSGVILTVGTGNTTNSTATITYGSAVVYAKTAVAMTYNFGYASTGTTMVYEIHVSVEGI